MAGLLLPLPRGRHDPGEEQQVQAWEVRALLAGSPEARGLERGPG